MIFAVILIVSSVTVAALVCFGYDGAAAGLAIANVLASLVDIATWKKRKP